MKPKINFDAQSMSWLVPGIDLESAVDEKVLRQSYRISLDCCKAAKCKRNCIANPLCLAALGGAQLFREYTDETLVISKYENDFAPERPRSRPTGLKNLGATCYFNSLLQVWFHGAFFRDTILRWNRLLDANEEQDVTRPPTTVVGHLQVIFSRLLLSPERCINPSAMVEMLGLDTEYQQDVSECSGLLFSLILDQLRQYHDPELAAQLENIFRGEQDMVIRCETCGYIKRRSQDFLNIILAVQGFNDIRQCLKSFGQKRKIEGDFRCVNCDKSVGATTFDELTKLPPILNIQLMRYSFDPKTGSRKKIKTAVRFPKSLDMSPFVKNSDGPLQYSLKAVLVHIGNSANSGHYVANVRINSKGDWFRLNDGYVTKIKGKLDVKALDTVAQNEDSPVDEGSSGDSQPNVPAQDEKKETVEDETIRSTSAYLLVYERQDLSLKNGGSSETSPELPKYSQDAIEEEWRRFREEHKQFDSQREQAKQKCSRFLEDFRKIQSCLPYNRIDSSFCVVGTQDYSDFLKAAVKRFEEMRTFGVTSPAVRNGGAITPPEEAMEVNSSSCPAGATCPHGRISPSDNALKKIKIISQGAARSLKVFCEKYKIDGMSNMKLTSVDESLCRQCVLSIAGSRLAKTRLTEKSKAVALLLKSTPDRGVWVGKKTLASWIKSAESHMNSKYLSTQPSPDAFNSELKCPHGSLSLAEKRVVSSECWSMMREFFDECVEFESKADVCHQCRDLVSSGKKEVQERSLAIGKLKRDLDSIVKSRQHFRETEEFAYALDKVQAELIRKYLRASKAPRPTGLTNSLLCVHGGTASDLKSQQSEVAKSFVLLSPDEWCVLESEFQLSGAVRIDRVRWESDPPYCEVCSEENLRVTTQRNGTFERLEIPVFKIPIDELDVKVAELGFADGPPQKRQRLGRGQRVKGCKRIPVSSSDKLVDLKVKIMSQHGISPILQKILLDEKLVSELASDKLLGEFGITADSVIFVAEDSSLEPLTESSLAKPQEFGFAGTKLQSC